MIKSIKIENFKCIRDLELRLAPLTIFIGHNGSGKTSILEAIALMSQAVRVGGGFLTNALRGNLVWIEDVDAIFHERDTKNWLSLGFEIELDKEESLDVKKEVLRDLERVSGRAGAFLSQLREKEIKTVKYVYSVRLTPSEQYGHLYELNGVRIKCFHDGSKLESSPKYISLRSVNEFLPVLYLDDISLKFSERLREITRRRFEKVYYFSSRRDVVNWYKQSERKKPSYVGREGEYTLDILSMLMKPENDDKRWPYELICKEFGVERVWAGLESDSILTSNYRDPWLKSAHKLPSLGHGSRQLVPVIAQLAFSEKGSIILIDEPEISLHPAYQVKLPTLFGNGVMEGKQILITTHSSYFPLSLHRLFDGTLKIAGQTTIGEKERLIKLNVEDVKVYHVSRSQKGYTNVHKLELDEDGLKEGIPSFIEVELELLSKFIKEE